MQAILCDLCHQYSTKTSNHIKLEIILPLKSYRNKIEIDLCSVCHGKVKDIEQKFVDFFKEFESGC